MVATLNVLQPSTEETSYYAVYFNTIIAGQITASTSTQITLGVLPGPGVTPSMVMAQGEMQGALLDALEGMEAIDREVLALRHFEELDNAEVARVLEIPPNTASKRYMRALERLAKVVKGGALGTS